MAIAFGDPKILDPHFVVRLSAMEGWAIVWLLEERVMKKMSHKDLERLVEKIRNESGCIVDLDALISRFEENVNQSSASRFIFESPTGRLLPANEVVDLAMRNKP